MSESSIDEIRDFTLELPHDLGRYRLEDEIGRGGMGIVYVAKDTMLDRDVAVKLLLPQLAADPQFVQRFTREAQMAAKLEHPNIVTVHDVGVSNGLVYFVMRMVIGKPMDRLQAEGLNWSHAEPIALQLADAMAYAHSHNVIHRDLKPENVIVGDDGAVTITDFGLARPEQQSSGGPTRAGVILGTPGYMAPEQALGEDVTARTDIYSFGVMLFEMLTGELPFKGNSPFAVINQHINTPAPRLSSIRSDAPAYLDQLVARCLEKSPDQRPASMVEVSDILKNQVGELVETKQAHETGHDVVARVRRGEVSLAAAIVNFPEQREQLEQLFRREMTAASFDLAGSTKLKQSGGTVALGVVFNRYRELVDTVLKDHEVQDVVWAGDGTVALFWQPSQAVAAGQAIIRGLRQLNKEFPETPDMDVRIGLHTGTILRDPNQTLGQVTSSTLDLTGHIQKDATPGLVEISEVTLDKLTSHEGFVPLRREHDRGMAIFAWHPDGPQHVPQGFMARVVQAVGGGGGETKRDPSRATQPGQASTRTTQSGQSSTRTTVSEELKCFYCKAPIRVQDQRCASCGRLNRHFDPNVDEKGRRKKPAPIVVQPKPAPEKERVAGAKDKAKAGGQQAARKPWEKVVDDDAPPIWSELLVGATITAVLWIVCVFVLRLFPSIYFTPGTFDARLPVALSPLALVGLVVLADFGVAPNRALGELLGAPLGYLVLAFVLHWL